MRESERPRRGADETPQAFRARRLVWAREQLQMRPLRMASPATGVITLDGRAYAIAASDGPRLTGAMWKVLGRQPAGIVLESGETLTLTPDNIDDVMGQLAGLAGQQEGTP
jgi:hypothetical protein